MKKFIVAFITSSALLSFGHTAVAGNESTAAECMSLKIEAKKYANKIKVGGTGQEMAMWNLAKSDAESRLEDSSCNPQPKKSN